MEYVYHDVGISFIPKFRVEGHAIEVAISNFPVHNIPEVSYPDCNIIKLVVHSFRLWAAFVD